MPRASPRYPRRSAMAATERHLRARAGTATPAPHARRRAARRRARSIDFALGHQALPERRRRARRTSPSRSSPGEFVFLVGAVRLRQVDDDAAADQGDRADLRRDPRRRPRPRRRSRARRSRTTAATSAWSSRTTSCCRTARSTTTSPTRCRSPAARGREIREKVPDILRLTGLSTKLHNYPDQLSGGEQQRVSVARAFVNHPPLLLADEPTGNLDPETSIGIMQLLYRINRTGTTGRGRHARRRDGRPHAPPRDRARRGPRRPRRAGRRLRGARDHARVRRPHAGRLE